MLIFSPIRLSRSGQTHHSHLPPPPPPTTRYAIFFLLALQPPLGVVFYSPLVSFSLLAYEVS